MKLRLPKEENISITGKTDPIHRHYHPVIRHFMNARLTGALALLGNQRCDRLLDIGYGGGVFLPELSTRCARLYGVDIHRNEAKVQAMLQRENVRARLSYGDVTHLPFSDGQFERVVCISVLEFVKDLDKAFKEISRVLTCNGDAIIGFPVENVLTDIGFFAIGIRARRVHPVDQNDILDAAGKYFVVERMRTFPFNLPLKLALFAHCRMRKR